MLHLALSVEHAHHTRDRNSLSVHHHLQQTDKAIQTLKIGIEKHPKWIKSYSRLASVYKQEAQNQEAIKTYREALIELPDSNYIKLLLASVHEVEKEFVAARSLYEDVLKSDRGNDAATNNLANLLLDRFISDENTKKALDMSERFAVSKQIFFKDTYAWALFKSGDARGAVLVIDQVLSGAPQHAIFHYHKAVIEKALGNRDKATSSLDAARKRIKEGEVELLSQINAML